MDKVTAAAALFASLGSITALVSVILLRRQRLAETRMAEHEVVEAERDSEYEWYEKWRDCVKAREEAALAHDKAIKQLQCRIETEEQKWQRALSTEVQRRQALETRVARLEQQIRSVGLDPINGGSP